MLSEVVRGLTNRCKFRATTNSQSFDSFGVEGNSDIHASVYMYNEDVLEYVKENNSLSGYSGDVVTDVLHWDFDSESNIKAAYNDTCELLGRLSDSGYDNASINVFFSGNKGYHVIASSLEAKELSGNNVPDKVKYICNKFATGLTTFDKSVYDRTRVLRVPNTVNPKSGLYKIGFTVDEFISLTPEEISSMAKTQRKTPERDKNPQQNQVTQQVIDEYTNNPEVQYDVKTGPRDYESLSSGIQVGNRNNTLTSLAGMLRSKNVAMDTISRIVHNENKLSGAPLPHKEVETIVKSISRYSPKTEYREISSSNIVTMEQAGKQWYTLRNRAREIDTGYKYLNKILQFFDPTETCFIAGRAGTMKTSSAMQLATNIANSINGDVLMASLEMGAAKVFFRGATIENNRELDTPDKNLDVTEKLMSNDSLYRKTCSAWSNMLITDMDSMSLDQIEAAWNQAQKMRNNNMQVLLIDYFGLIKNDGSYQDMSIVARGLKSLAKRINTRVICLSQFSRLAGNGTEEPEMHMMRDTGALEEAADYAIGLWRDPNDKFRIHAKDMKNRNDDNDSTVKWDFINHGIYLKEEEFTETKARKSSDTSGVFGG